MSRFAAVILAAGQASRYRDAGGREATKLLECIDGEILLRRVAIAALRSRAEPVIVVTGHAAESLKPVVADLSVSFVHNADYMTGLAGSLGRGLGAVPETHDGAVVMLGDMPGITVSLVDALLARADDKQVDAVVPVAGGQRGNPVVLKRSMFVKAMALSGDTGARRLLHDPELRVAELHVDEAAIFDDIDVPSQLQTHNT